MKLIIKNDSKETVKNPNVKIIETTEASFTNQTVFIEENDVPIIKYTDTETMFFVKDLDNLYDRKSRSEVLLDITIDNLELIGSGSGGGIESVSGGLVNNTDPSNPVIADAPSDGTQYTRKDGTWEVVASSSAGKQLKALIGTTSSDGNITVYTPLVNSIGLINPVWSRVQQGIYSLTFSNTASVFTGTFFTIAGINTSYADTRIITVKKIGNTFYIYSVNMTDGSNVDLLVNDKYSLFFESL